MKKLLVLVMSLILSLTAVFSLTGCGVVDDLAAVKAAGKLVVGITDYEPMDYKDENNEWTGFDAELSKMFAQRLGVECVFVEIVDWNNKVAEINSNQIDLIWNGMTATEELGEQIDFSVSYAKNAQVAVVLNTSNITTKEQIKNASIAVENGSAGQNVTVEEGMTNVSAPGNQKQALIEVKSGNSEVAIIDITMAQSLVGTGEFNTLKIVEGVSYGDEIFAVGLRKKSNLKAELDAFLKEQYRNGTITQLALQYKVGINTEALSK